MGKAQVQFKDKLNLADLSPGGSSGVGMAQPLMSAILHLLVSLLNSFFAGVPDSSCHWPVLHGTRLGDALSLQLHTENSGGHGNVEPFLLFCQCVYQQMDFCNVSFGISL